MLLQSILNKIVTVIEMPFQIIVWQIKQNECQKLSDNILLWKLRNRAPKVFDRDLEYPWMLKNINIRKGKLLDVGSTIGGMLYDLLPKDIEINTININTQRYIQNIHQYTGDIRNTDIKDETFDIITCISTLEHIGVEGRYNVKNDPDGDIKAMKEMHRLLKKNGRLILTVPYGARNVLPINRLYNNERIKKLFHGYKVVKEEYLKYNSKYGIWLNVSEQEAAKTDWLIERWYALGLFVLEKLAK